MILIITSLSRIRQIEQTVLAKKIPIRIQRVIARDDIVGEESK